jgi:hypothetical protein
MDRDGKGCCLMVLAVLGGVFVAGCGIAGIIVWSLLK